MGISQCQGSGRAVMLLRFWIYYFVTCTVYLLHFAASACECCNFSLLRFVFRLMKVLCSAFHIHGFVGALFSQKKPETSMWFLYALHSIL